MTGERKSSTRKFGVADRSEVPNGRKGKHNRIVHKILDELKILDTGHCLKIPLADLPDTKVNVRSALNREVRKLGRNVATAADNDYLYIWNS